MPAIEAATHLTQPYTIECGSVQEAKTLEANNQAITTREGRRVTFHRSSWHRTLGKTKPTRP